LFAYVNQVRSFTHSLCFSPRGHGTVLAALRRALKTAGARIGLSSMSMNYRRAGGGPDYLAGRWGRLWRCKCGVWGRRGRAGRAALDGCRHGGQPLARANTT